MQWTEPTVENLFGTNGNILDSLNGFRRNLCNPAGLEACDPRVLAPTLVQ